MCSECASEVPSDVKNDPERVGLLEGFARLGEFTFPSGSGGLADRLDDWLKSARAAKRRLYRWGVRLFAVTAIAFVLGFGVVLWVIATNRVDDPDAFGAVSAIAVLTCGGLVFVGARATLGLSWAYSLRAGQILDFALALEISRTAVPEETLETSTVAGPKEMSLAAVAQALAAQRRSVGGLLAASVVKIPNEGG